MEKNDNPNNGMRGDDDDRSQGGSGDEDVFIQAAAIAGDLNTDATTGKYHIVDESGPVGVRKKFFLNLFIKQFFIHFSEKFVIE
jgi:hypothetical protein